MKPATKLIHAGERGIGTAVPLTTPIYETSTFVFDTAHAQPLGAETPTVPLSAPEPWERFVGTSE